MNDFISNDFCYEVLLSSFLLSFDEILKILLPFDEFLKSCCHLTRFLKNAQFYYLAGLSKILAV